MTLVAQVRVKGKNVIIDGLLCSIIKAHSRNPPKDELERIILRDATESEITGAWQSMFSFFDEEIDKSRGLEIFKIKRTSLELIVKDIVEMITKLDKEKNFEMFVMPWSYKVKPLPCESEQRNTYWEEERMKDVSNKYDDFERTMEAKHDALVSNLTRWTESLLRVVKPGAENQLAAFMNNSNSKNDIWPVLPIPHGAQPK